MFLLKKINDLIIPRSRSLIEEEILKSFPVSRLLDYYGQDGSNPACLYLGDSVAERISQHDVDKRSINQILSDKIDDFGCLSHSAYHSGVFYLLSRVIQTFKKKPSTIILPINMRSFSPQWDLYPLFQCTDHIDLIKKYIYMLGRKIDYPLYGIDRAGDEKTFYQTEVKYFCSDFSYVKQFTDVAWNKEKYRNDKRFRYRIVFIFHYLYSLEINHRKLLLLKDIIRLLSDIGIRPLVYVTPINHRAGVKYVGEEFSSYHRMNVDALREALGEFYDIISFHDYSMIFDSDLFFHENDTTEHLNENGRAKLACLICDEYKKLVS